MKKFIYIILLFVNIIFGQSPEIKTDLPTIIPPSPTVAALMKFEEVPVSNYTGVPDIKIPITNIPTANRNLSVNINLSYHPSGVKIDELSSWAGTGWSLMGIGVISRTVKGVADDNMVYSKGLYGLENNFEELFFDNLGNLNNFNDLSHHDYQKFFYDVSVKGKYDTQYDIYSFNFNGYSGSFYINKNGQVIKLYNDNAIKIDYDSLSKKFTLYDEKGFKYIFNEKEVTSELNETYNTSQIGSIFNLPVNQQSPSFNSAFFITEIIDNNNKVVVKYNYDTIVESYENRSITKNKYLELNGAISVSLVNGNMVETNPLNNPYDLKNKLLPKNSLDKSTLTIQTKKIRKIEIVGLSNVYFTNEVGRLDLNSEAVRLKGIEIKDSKDNLIKKIQLFHSYEGEGNRLVLNKVTEEGKDNSTQILSTEMFYKKINSLPERFSNKKDDWNYFNNDPAISNFERFTSEEYCTVGLLQKMKIPTGGCYVFDFESNDYSYTGDVAEMDFINDKNKVPHTFNENYIGYSSENQNSYRIFYNHFDQDVNFDINTLNNPFPFENKMMWYFEIIPITLSPPSLSGLQLNYVNFYQVDNSRISNYIKLNEIDQSLVSNNYYKSLSLKKGWYVIRFKQSDTANLATSSVTYNLKLNYYNLINTHKYLAGGGVRIKYIGYFSDGNTSQNYYNDINKYPFIQHGTPSFEKKYSYTFFDDLTRSSGSLAFPKPVYSFIKKVTHLEKTSGSGSNPSLPIVNAVSAICEVERDNTILAAFKTHGADIGYKNVVVQTNVREFNEIQNGIVTNYVPFDNAYEGKIEYTYSSPIDFPENAIIYQYPITPTNNIDYKRGLITKEQVYDFNDKLVKKSVYDYNFEEDLKTYGIQVHDVNGGCSYFELYDSYDNYNNYASQGNQLNPYHCNLPLQPNLIDFRPVRYAIGWSKLTNKTTKNYFYPNGSSIPNITQTDETYAYNPINKQISESTVTNSTNETLKTKYFYHTGNSIYSQNRIGEIESVETYRGAELLSKSKVNYGNVWQNNISFLPQSIETLRGTNTLENRLEYKQYDEFSNPLEVQQESGIPITYIWGYNQTQPIAKIENATYAEVQQYEANLQTLSNGTDEASLITALNNLRTALPNAMVTTYTYKPLVGISTVTDPTGNKITYHYDSFNRLQFVKDKDGNNLSENEYHYKN